MILEVRECGWSKAAALLECSAGLEEREDEVGLKGKGLVFRRRRHTQILAFRLAFTEQDYPYHPSILLPAYLPTEARLIWRTLCSHPYLAWAIYPRMKDRCSSFRWNVTIDGFARDTMVVFAQTLAAYMLSVVEHPQCRVNVECGLWTRSIRFTVHMCTASIIAK